MSAARVVAMPAKRQPTLSPSELEQATADFLGAVSVTEGTIADWLNAVNGRVKLPVPHVAGELRKEMLGGVPDWSIA